VSLSETDPSIAATNNIHSEVKTMAKTMTNNQSSSSTDETKKQRKKQAKREAKAMLAVEQAKQDVQKAEQKVAKFQARLEACVAHLRTLEAKLTRIRTSPQGPGTDAIGGGVDGHQEQSDPAQETASADAGSSQPVTITEEDEATTGAPVPASPVNIASPTEQEVSLPPAEGRADIPQDQETAASDAEASASTSSASDTSVPLPEESMGTPQQQTLPSESEDDASSSDPTHTETAGPANEAGEETRATEENFHWWSGSENKATSAHHTPDSRPASEEEETQEGLGSVTRQPGQRLTVTEEEREWQPEEDASQSAGTSD